MVVSGPQIQHQNIYFMIIMRPRIWIYAYVKVSWTNSLSKMFNWKLGTRLNKLKNLNSRCNMYEISFGYELEGPGEQFAQILSFWTKMGLHGWNFKERAWGYLGH